jgi:hypothetical protein
VRYRYSIPNAGWELPLPFQHCLKHIFYSRPPHSLSCTRVGSISIHQKLDQFTQYPLLTLGT